MVIDDELRRLQLQVESFAHLISVPAYLLPTYGRSEDFARPHLEVNGDGLHFVVVERGQEQLRRTTRQLDELLYWVFDGVTFSMAVKYEARHRVPGQDFRRLLFQHQLELLQQLKLAWAERCGREMAAVLRQHPFEDD